MMRGLFLAACLIASPATAQLTNAPTRATATPVTETVHGVTTTDRYRWMEEPSRKEDVTAFVRASSDFAIAEIRRLPRRAEFVRILEAANRSGVRFSDVALAAGRMFYRRLDPSDRVAKLVVRDKGVERVLIDPGAGGANAAVGVWTVSPDGKIVAAHVSEGGSEAGQMRFIDVATGRETRPRLGPIWGEFEVTWLSSTRVVYTLMMPGGADPMQGMRCFVGDATGSGNDVAVLGAGVAGAPQFDTASFPGVFTGFESNWVVGAAFNARADQIWYVARRADIAAGKSVWRSVATLADKVSSVALRGDRLVMVTTKAVSNGEVVVVDLKTDARQALSLPAGVVVTGVLAADDGLYVTAQSDGVARLLFSPVGQTVAREVDLPFEADIRNPRAEVFGHGMTFSLVGWATAPRSFAAWQGEIRSLDLDSVGWAEALKFVVSREEATSADGTKVPMVMVSPAGSNGPKPVMLDAYGGYGVPSVTPWYNPNYLSWTGGGGIAAFCGTRGGNERGRAWHEGGREANKPNAHADYIACAERLIELGVARPGGIAATGTSAGGLLVPVAVQKRPDLFGALLPRVAVVNPTRMAAAENGANQFTEMGDPTTPDGYRALVGQDAYLGLETASDLPDTLITVGLNDRRVAPWMGAKFAARALERFGSKRLVLIRADSEQGHGFGSALDLQIAEFADAFAFIADRLAANAR